jgi:CBS domain containing-hemolysin-like protein
MTDRAVLIALLLVVSLAISFLFSGMESGVFALNRLRIRQLKRAGDRRAMVLHGFLENSENFLWTIFVGNTVANFTILTLLAWSLHNWLGGLIVWELISFVAGVFLFFIFCELLPKTLFRLFPNRLCLWLAQPFRLIHIVLRPLVAPAAWFSRQLLSWTGGKIFTGHLFGTREELRFIMQEASPNLTSDERTMINRVLDLQNLTVAHVTVALANTVTVATDTPMDEVLKICQERNLTRLPVIHKDGASERVVGIISLKRLLYRDDLNRSKSAGDYVNPALYLRDNLRLEEALRRMQRSGRRLAVVLNRERREIGIISLQDILKTIFGEVSL